MIELPREQKESNYLSIKKEFKRFSRRLDNFMNLSNAFVVANGGYGNIIRTSLYLTIDTSKTYL